MSFTRRDLGRLALAALPASLLAKPDSKWGGVQIGINVPYSYRGLPGSAEDVLVMTTGLGLIAVELRSQPVEACFWGSEFFAHRYGSGDHRRGESRYSRGGRGAGEMAAGGLIKKFKEFRKKYEDAGLAIQVVKFDGVDKMKDEVVDYAFEVAEQRWGRMRCRARSL